MMIFLLGQNTFSGQIRKDRRAPIESAARGVKRKIRAMPLPRAGHRSHSEGHRSLLRTTPLPPPPSSPQARGHTFPLREAFPEINEVWTAGLYGC
jgi:hypothetical protein